MIPHSQPLITTNIYNRVKKLLDANSLQSPEYIDSVLENFCKKFFLNNFYFTSNGTSALYWIIKGLNLKKEDEVIIPTYVCSSVYTAIKKANATPVLCDIGDSWHISPKTVERKITKNTKAIVIVNLFGMNLECRKFRDFNVTIINDLCQSFHCLKNKDADHGDYAFFSFHPTKFITAGFGGGYSILKKHDECEIRLTKAKINPGISNLNAAILDEQINLYEEIVEKRKKIANIYFRSVSEEYTHTLEKNDNVFYRFPILYPQNNQRDIEKKFSDNGITVRKGVDELIHRKLKIPDTGFEKAVRAYNETISIPIYPSLKGKSINKIASHLGEI